jgi:hypothetical protein
MQSTKRLLGIPLSVAAAAAWGGCGAAPGDGTPAVPMVQRYVIDQIQLPMRREDYADDLNGDGLLDNQLGTIEGTLSTNQDDGSVSIPPMLAECARLPQVEVEGLGALDGDTQTTLEVHWLPAAGATPSILDGQAWQGRYVSMRARVSGEPVAGRVRLPIFSHTDPIELDMVAVEMELGRDARGLSGQLHGAIPPTVDIRPAAWAAFVQMLQNEPGGHDQFVSEIDANHDGVVSLDEFEHDPIIANLIAPDVQLFDEAGHFAPSAGNHARDSISLGFGFHLTACGDASCPCAGPP